jgi:uncharacterized RDD family membrane protein YckC
MTDLALLWRRFFAFLIDLVPAVLVALGVGFAFGFTQEMFEYWGDSSTVGRAEFIPARNAVRDTSFLLYILMAALMEASPMGGTVGKRILGIRSVDAGGERLTIWRSLARNLAKIVSVIPLGAGFAWAFIDKSDRGWHDLIAGTHVVRKRSLAEPGDIPAAATPGAGD